MGGGGLKERGNFELKGGNLLLGGFFFLYVGLFILCKEKKWDNYSNIYIY